MNIEEFREYCLQKTAVTEELPFDENTLVFKVAGKMFALTDIEEFKSINLKCDPEVAIYLREKYDGSVLPGYHMNKKHWNTVVVGGSVPEIEFFSMIDKSYELVVSSISKNKRLEYGL